MSGFYNSLKGNHKKKAGLLNCFLFLLLFLFHPATFDDYQIPASVHAADANVKKGRAEAFLVPKRMRPRVDFWKDIFTKYGRNHAVLHHRHFPQIVFQVMDFTAAQETLAPNVFSKYRERILKERIEEIMTSMAHLGEGNTPRNKLEQKIVSAMAFLPGGADKYKQVVADSLIRSQTGIREKYAIAIERSGRYLPIIEEIFIKEFNLPVELTRLPFIESSFDYLAYSSVGAAGIWQFMPKTGKLYMTINSIVDERRNPIEASRAAARYLISAYNQLGSWPLAVTSYNHGVAGVSRRVRDYGSSDLTAIIEDPNKRVFGFASTNFYPEFLAAIEIYDDYKKYFPGIVPEPTLKMVELRLNHSLPVSVVVARLGITAEQLQRYNYALSRHVWSGHSKIPAGYILRVPKEFEGRLATLRTATSIGAASSKQGSGGSANKYLVRKGDTISKIAKQFSVSSEDLIVENNLKGRGLRTGETIIIPQRQVKGQASKTVAPKNISKRSSSANRQSRKTVIVKKGDTLSSISKSTGVSTANLRRLNNLKSDQINVGAVLRLE